MELSVERDGGVMYCFVEGRVDGETAVAFRDGVLNIVEDNDRILVLDLGGVVYVSSAGLQSFVIIARQLAREGVGFALCHLAEGVRHVFEISGFDGVLSIFGDSSEAVAALEN